MKPLHQIKQAAQLWLLKRDVIREVIKDKNATLFAVISILIGVIASTLAYPLNYGENKIIPYQYAFLIFLFSLLLSYGIIHIFAKLFTSKAKFIHLIRPAGYTYLISSLLLIIYAIIPEKIQFVFQILIVLWSIAVTFVILKEVYKFGNGKTIALFLITGFIWFILFFIIGVLIAIGGFFLGIIPLDTYQYNFNGSLQVEDVMLGVSRDGCIFGDIGEYTPEDVLCIGLSNITGFIKNNNSQTNYNVDLRVWSSNGTLARHSKKILDEEPKYVKEDYIDYISVTSKLRSRLPGEYTYEIILYDLNSNRGVFINRTISVVKPTQERELNFSGSVLCQYNGKVCQSVQRILRNEALYIYATDVQGLKEDYQGQTWPEMDITIKSENGTIIKTEEKVFGTKGHALFKNNPDNAYYAGIIDTDLGVGKYFVEAKLYDLISRKSAILKNTFEVITPEQAGNLKIDKLILGYDLDYLCSKNEENIFSNKQKNRVCIQPMKVTGFEKDKDNVNWFDMALVVRDSSNKEVMSFENAFGANGYVYLHNNILSGYWVRFPVNNLTEGAYTFELTIMDKISKRQANYKGSFQIISSSVSEKIEPEGAIRDTLEVNEKKTYVLSGIEYDVTVVSISDEFDKVTFNVNGELTPELSQSDTYILPGGTEIGINNFRYNSVEFYLLRYK